MPDDEETHQPALGNSRCPICLTLTSIADEAFLDQCYHRFCFQCIDSWTRQQLAHATSGPLRCPTCRQPYVSVLLDCVHQAYRRKVYVRGAQVSDGAYKLSAAQRRRRSLYAPQALVGTAEPDPSAPARRPLPNATFAQSLARQEVDRWALRELQALLLQDDVALVAAHILGTARHAAQSGQESCQAAAAAASAPYVFEQAEAFAEQLCSFVAARSSVGAYDVRVFGPPGSAQPARSGSASDSSSGAAEGGTVSGTTGPGDETADTDDEGLSPDAPDSSVSY